ncbi:hypothetical protein OWR29_44150 [Actinoplanes sp. Pm04-4]|uniref:Uncharacterized protein n=1 Tax=Paractinoplanes pyxinae TaxID=2997416 RepID=A0ABT4BHG0_9ACTN|nr:hypothetical protein [Actinoplanes pyxinae]MCY1145035.1 hypothetical protein [Actinoplanes pyxinae]
MQIVEVSDFGVRSAVLRLTRAGTPLRFEFYPMVHVGEPAFYAAVTERLRRCDLVVAEGVGRGGSWAAGALSLSYQLPARFRRSGLVEQDIPLDSLGVPVRYPDLTGEQFSAGWQAVPWWQRAVATVGAPLVGLERLAFGSRRAMAAAMEVSDTDWREELARAESMDELLSLIGEQRDRLLVSELDDIHTHRAHERITVGIVYGAKHVPPAVHGLRALHRYAPRGAEWLTVINY